MRLKNRQRTVTSKTAAQTSSRKRPLHRWIKRNIKFTASLAIIIVAVSGPVWLWKSNWVHTKLDIFFFALAEASANAGLKTQRVLLQGRKYESTTKIKSALNIEMGTPLFLIDLDTARENLESLPWVRAASVEREFPGTVRVRIIERQPLALWEQKGRLVLIDKKGGLISSQNIEKFRKLLVLVGKNAPSNANSLITMLAREPELHQRVDAAIRVGDRRWNIRMDNGIYIRLPEKNAIDAWNRFAKLERKHKLLKQDLVSIDLRIPDQLIVRTRNGRSGDKVNVNTRKGKTT